MKDGETSNNDSGTAHNNESEPELENLLEGTIGLGDVLDIELHKYKKALYWYKSDRYLLKAADLFWIELTKADLTQHLKSDGFAEIVKEMFPDWDENRNQKKRLDAAQGWVLREFMVYTRTNWRIGGFGRVGMRHEGIYDWDDQLYLVTKSPKVINPARGDCDFVKGIIQQLLPLREGSDIAQYHLISPSFFADSPRQSHYLVRSQNLLIKPHSL